MSAELLNTVFLRILNMSLTASFAIFFVLLARVLLKKAPKIFSYALWAVVLIRLLCPISLEGIWSVIPVNQTAISAEVIYAEIPKVDTGIQVLDNQINPVLQGQGATPYTSANPMQIWLFIGEAIWLFGIMILIAYSVVSLLKLHRKLVGAVKLERNIHLADHVESPFVIGVLFPQIYLPSSLPEAERGYIILHEECHIRRLDHVLKLLAFLALCLHWFNPLVWVAFVLSTKDMEMSCDEAVMKKMDGDIRGEYSASLLSLATGKRIIMGTPLAFGEGDTTGRIKNVLGYKKAKNWVIGIALVVVVGIGVSLLGNTSQYDTIETVFPEFPVAEVFHAVVEEDDADVIVDENSLYEEGRDPEEYEFVKEIEVSKEPINQDISMDRDNTYPFSFYDGKIDYTLYINFNEDYSEVWLDDGTTVSPSHRVKDPEKVAADVKKNISMEGLAKGTWPDDLIEAGIPYVGDAPAVGNIIHMLQLPAGLTYTQLALNTVEEPYGITITYSCDKNIFEKYEASRNSIKYTGLGQMQRIGYVLFVLVDNVGYVDIIVAEDDSENQLVYRYEREKAEEMVGYDLREATEDRYVFLELLWGKTTLYDARMEGNIPASDSDSLPQDDEIGVTEEDASTP